MWEILAVESESITIVESTDQVGTNIPFDIVGGPVDGIGGHGADRVGDRVVDGSVVGSGVSLSEEVAFNLRIIGSKPLPIDFIEVIGFEDEAANDTGTRAGFGCH